MQGMRSARLVHESALHAAAGLASQPTRILCVTRIIPNVTHSTQCLARSYSELSSNVASTSKTTLDSPLPLPLTSVPPTSTLPSLERDNKASFAPAVSSTEPRATPLDPTGYLERIRRLLDKRLNAKDAGRLASSIVNSVPLPPGTDRDRLVRLAWSMAIDVLGPRGCGQLQRLLQTDTWNKWVRPVEGRVEDLLERAYAAHLQGLFSDSRRNRLETPKTQSLVLERMQMRNKLEWAVKGVLQTALRDGVPCRGKLRSAVELGYGELGEDVPDSLQRLLETHNVARPAASSGSTFALPDVRLSPAALVRRIIHWRRNGCSLDAALVQVSSLLSSSKRSPTLDLARVAGALLSTDIYAHRDVLRVTQALDISPTPIIWAQATRNALARSGVEAAVKLLEEQHRRGTTVKSGAAYAVITELVGRGEVTQKELGTAVRVFELLSAGRWEDGEPNEPLVGTQSAPSVDASLSSTSTSAASASTSDVDSRSDDRDSTQSRLLPLLMALKSRHDFTARDKWIDSILDYHDTRGLVLDSSHPGSHHLTASLLRASSHADAVDTLIAFRNDHQRVPDNILRGALGRIMRFEFADAAAMPLEVFERAANMQLELDIGLLVSYATAFSRGTGARLHALSQRRQGFDSAEYALLAASAEETLQRVETMLNDSVRADDAETRRTVQTALMDAYDSIKATTHATRIRNALFVVPSLDRAAQLKLLGSATTRSAVDAAWETIIFHPELPEPVVKAKYIHVLLRGGFFREGVESAISMFPEDDPEDAAGRFVVAMLRAYPLGREDSEVVEKHFKRTMEDPRTAERANRSLEHRKAMGRIVANPKPFVHVDGQS